MRHLRESAVFKCPAHFSSGEGTIVAEKLKTPNGTPEAVTILPPPANGQSVGPDVVVRFSKLEERFLQRFKEIEAETARTLSAHDSDAKKQVDSLAAQPRRGAGQIRSIALTEDV
jgi:hypothetical protein